MVCFVILWFGIYNGFSGQPLFLEWAFQLYNLLFSALPILIYAIFDRDVDTPILEGNPRIYGLSNKAGFFRPWIFWQWMMHGLLQSVVLFFLPLSIWGVSSSNGNTGRQDGFIPMGIVVYTCVVIVVNLKIAFHMQSWTWLHHFSLWISIGVYFACMIVFSLTSVFSLNGIDYYWLLFEVLKTPKFYLTVIVTCVAALWWDYMVMATRELKYNKEIEEALPEGAYRHVVERVEEPELKDGAPLLTRQDTRHTGFDFSYTHIDAGTLLPSQKLGKGPKSVIQIT